MSKISTYEVAPVPKLADKLIGTSVGGEIEDVTYNFTLQELLEVFLPVIPANNLQGVLDYGNTATQDINLFGTITTTNLDVTDTANLFITYLNEETHIVGGLFDSEDSIGLAGQVLTSTGEFVEWITLPPIFTPNLQQVLDIGNTSDTGIILDAGLEALDVDTDTATINTNITIDGTITDEDGGVGVSGSVLSSTVTGVKWVPLPVYSATSPLLFNSATGVFSIQQATNSQNGYLSSSDWITFDGKQNAGNYITALTGEATASGPGSATVTLGNAAVIGKVLTGFNPTAGTINASDSILTAFGKTQSQINALVGGVQYQGVWNASTNTPTLTSSVGVQGHYYVVNVAGNTNLNGITDWQIGDWAIFSESVWQKVDNTESVSSVNGFTGAVSLTTDNIPEGTTNLYFLNSRARTALSFAAGSGAYNSTTGVITIPTDNNQILNGANYITLGSLSATAPLTYNNLTGVFSIPQATSLVNGYLSATDWTTFNSKQNYLGGTGLVKSTAGTISYITDNSTNWNTAYDRSIVSAAVTGTTTKTLTLNEQDGGTITASWTDLDTGLTSVGVSMPSAFSVANSPLTANGTIAVTGAGTSLQYIDGTGALQTFPGLTGFVPYTGATANVDLGTFGLISDYLRLNITPSSIPTTVGTMSWNNSDGTMDIRLKGGNVTLQVGEETVVRVVNKSGVDLLEANYQVVRVRNEAEGGAQGQRLAVVLARANTKVNHTGLLGIVTETINSNQEGFVTNFGIVRDIDTTGDLQGETWVDGDVLWLSETTAGALTNIEPTTHPIQIGYVIYAHANNGKIFVYLQEGVDELDELHDVSITSVANNQGLFYDSATSLWKNKSIATALGYTPADAATTLTINGTTYDLSANRTWSVGTVTSVAALTLGTTGTDLSSTVATGTTTPVITLNVPTASAANRGALSAADWSTFNTKVGSVTASSPLASSGGSTPNITIQQSSGGQDGYLSSTDWTTFNSKQAAGNYITSLTGEATASGPGAAAVTLNNASVTGKVLTGVNITGGSISASDSILTAFGKVQNQINGLIGSTIYQGTWNAATNTPALASGIGVRGYYYIVSVAGTTNLDGISDWFVGDWAIFDGTAWQQVDNTDAVVSVNGQTGAVSLTTDNISEGTTNLYYLNSRARAALSFTAGSGAYNSTTGVITIPTNNNQITNGANYITLGSLSGTAPISYNSGTGAISITQSGTASNGFLSSTDWNTFNNKQPAGSYVTLTGVQTLSNKTFSDVVNLSVNGYILAGATGVNPLQMYSTTLASNFLFGSNSFGTNINNDLFYSKDSSNRSVLSFNNTAERTYTFPNATGTLALTSQLTGGTVTSVAASAGAGISVSGSPITTSGTLTITNTAPYSGEAVIVAGGGTTSSVRCGVGNTATGTGTASLGGASNCATGPYDAVVGGFNNKVTSSNQSFIGGGCQNLISTGSWQTIAGGIGNCIVSGGYNFIGGGYFNTLCTLASESAIVVGGGNTVSGSYSAILSGHIGVVSGKCSSLAGGKSNLVSGSLSFIGGGTSNTASGYRSALLGGQSNTASGGCSFIGGGISNAASGGLSTVAGGTGHTSSGTGSFIGGGYFNVSNCGYTTVSGGQQNTASGRYSTVSGGICNDASGDVSIVGGGSFNKIVSAVSTPDVVGATIAGGVGNNTTGGVFNTCGLVTTIPTIVKAGQYSFIGGGFQNRATGLGSVIGGGNFNLSSANYSIAAGGYGNVASGNASGIAGGQANTASSGHSFVGGGYLNNAAGACAAILGGLCNLVVGTFNTIGGGFRNCITSASANYNFIGGGQDNTITSAAGIGTIVSGYLNTSSGQYGFIGAGTANNLSGRCSAIVGGKSNTVSNIYSFIGGGRNNTTTTPRSTVAGGDTNNVSADYGFIGGGDANTITSGFRSVISGGQGNRICGGSSGCNVIGGGWTNCITTGFVNTIGGGFNNRIIGGSYQAIAGGYSNQISSGTESGIVTGGGNSVSGNYSVVVGGQANTASGVCSGVLGGRGNTASGNHSAVLGGAANSATGNCSAAFGCNVTASAAATFYSNNFCACACMFATGFFETSDCRLKNIHNSFSAYDGINFTEFSWKTDETNKTCYGYIAQEVEKVLPNAIHNNIEGYKQVDYNQVNAYKLSKLEARIAKLESKI
jgi:hypothetical protein